MHAELFGLRHQRGVVDRLPDQAPLLRLLRGQRLGQAAQARAPAPGRPAAASSQVPPASGTRPSRANGLQEGRRARRQHDVAGQRDVAGGAGRRAVDRADHGKRQRAQLADQRIVVLFERLARHDHLARRRDPLVEILAGRERASRAGQQQRAAALVLLGLGDGRRQRLVHRLGEGVEPVRAVERDDAIAGAPVDQNRIVVHRSLQRQSAGRAADARASRACAAARATIPARRSRSPGRPAWSAATATPRR